MSQRDDDGQIEYGDHIDQGTFEQILEMDEDEDERDFSKSIVFGFFEQADETFIKMDNELKDKNLKELSRLGHFLKGSSATLGMSKVQHGCEKIQHYGSHQDEAGEPSKDNDETLLKKIKDTLAKVRVDYAEAEKRLKAFYGEE